MLTIMERKKGESARDYVTRVLIDAPSLSSGRYITS